jgi:hypothetical protein
MRLLEKHLENARFRFFEGGRGSSNGLSGNSDRTPKEMFQNVISMLFDRVHFKKQVGRGDGGKFFCCDEGQTV